jgi:hypothetical protein
VRKQTRTIFSPQDIIQLERFYSRRNRYVLVANFGQLPESLQEPILQISVSTKKTFLKLFLATKKTFWSQFYDF